LEPVDNPVIRREVARAQRIVEGQNHEIRHTLWRYSHFVEKQRRIVSERRRALLSGAVRPGVLQERVPAARESARQVLGEAALLDLERRLLLHGIDECWSDHLATVAEIRDGIHLVEVGGLSPLEEFYKRAAASFDHVLDGIDARVVERFTELEITPDGVDVDELGLRGPSSTWTYLVSDTVSTDGLAAALVSQRNIGFAAGAALTGPLLVLWALSRRLRRRDER
jgi:preprotein translocase subunit SecA